jgi:hypothetical protein
VPHRSGATELFACLLALDEKPYPDSDCFLLELEELEPDSFLLEPDECSLDTDCFPLKIDKPDMSHTD